MICKLSGGGCALAVCLLWEGGSEFDGRVPVISVGTLSHCVCVCVCDQTGWWTSRACGSCDRTRWGCSMR